VNRLKVQREERRRERRDLYKCNGVLYALPAVCLDISSAEPQLGQSVQQYLLLVYLDRESQHRLMSCMRMKTCKKMVAV